MLLENILIGVMSGAIGYSLNLISSAKDKEEKEIDIDNIVKYEYIPIEDIEEKKIDLNKVKYSFVEGDKNGVKAFIGYDIEGNLKELDILEGHTIAGGASRWGKSSFLNVFITNITKTYTRNEVCFLGCDY